MIASASEPSPPKSSSSSRTTGSTKTDPRREEQAGWRCVQSNNAYEMGLFSKDQTQAEEEGEVSGSSATFWDVLLTVYLPIVLLWLRRSMFGTANLIRSLFMGQCVQLFLTYAPKQSRMRETLAQHPWIQSLLGLAPSAKDPHSWPPPTLRVLAVLTIVALIVHPDGMTWVIFSKIRDGTMAFLYSTKTCWNFLLQDYGILPTLLASTTFLALGGLIWILHRTLTPTPTKPAPPERQKKKKRKGHARGGGRSGRTLPPHRQRPAQRPIPERNVASERLSPELIQSHDSVDPKSNDPIKTGGDSVSSEVSQKDSHRPRVESRDTVTTDDHSCDSASIRSNASALISLGEQSEKLRAEVDGVPLGQGSTRTLSRRKVQGRRGKKTGAADGETEEGYDSRVGKTVSSPSKASSESKARTNVSKSMSPSGRFAALALKHPDSASRRNRRKGRRFQSASPPQAVSPAIPSSSYFDSTSGFDGSERTASSRRFAGQVSLDVPMSPSLFSQDLIVPNKTPVSARQGMVPPNSGLEAHQQQQRHFGNFRYSVPDYTNYSQVDGRYAPGKIELAAFLAQVGLVGTACADLLEDLADVDALETLSDVQYELYNVAPAKKEHIELLLEARRRALAPMIASPVVSPLETMGGATAIRPPPGLERSFGGSTVGSVGEAFSPDLPLLLSPSKPTSTSGLELPTLEPKHSAAPSPSQYAAFGEIAPSMIASEPSGSSCPPEDNLSREDEEESSRIEAELQELGGQMVGSILDF